MHSVVNLHIIEKELLKKLIYVIYLLLQVYCICNCIYIISESGIVGTVVVAIDINSVANDVYKHNFPKITVMNRNIQSISAQKLNELNVDIILMSPPCQPFTRLGLKKDTLDNRACSLFYILSLISELTNLKYILLENVKGFETSQMRDKVINCLESCGYIYRELILSPCEFGIPNSRCRYYLLAKRNEFKFCFKQPSLENSLLPELLELSSKSTYNQLADKINPKSNKMCYTLDNILENNDNSKYLLPLKLIQKRAWVLDIRTSKDNGSCCFTKAYGHYATGTGSVYCPFSNETIIQNLNKANHEKDLDKQIQILSNLKLRYFSPKEVCRLMCFPEYFEFPKHITDKQKYKLLGNSINVHVVSKLIFLLCNENKNI